MELTPQFDDWYRGHYGKVLAAAVVCAGGDMALAEDATSEAFVKALQKWDVVSEMKSPMGWTITVAANRVRRLHRLRLLRRAREEQFGSADPAVLNHYNSEHAHVWEAVAKLSNRQREVLVRRYIHDETQAATADALGVTPGTAAATLHQARARMREELTPNEGTTS